MTYTVQVDIMAEGGNASIKARTPEELDAALDRILAAPMLHHNPTLAIVERISDDDAWPDHGLKLDVIPADGVGALAYYGEGPEGFGPWVSMGSVAESSTRKLLADIDSATPFPDDAAVSVETIREAVHEFHKTGGRRPTAVRWQAGEGW